MGSASTPSARSRRSRRRVAARGLVAIGVGAVLYAGGWLPMAAVAIAAGVSLALAAGLAPVGWVARIEAAGPWLGRAGSAVVTWPLLFVVFWLVIVPFGVLFRRGRNDPLRRTFDAAAPTYWQRPTRPSDAARPF